MIRFTSKKIDLDSDKEDRIRYIIETVKEHLELPVDIEIFIKQLPGHLYGTLDLSRVNRITLNSILSTDELTEVLVHELIHVHQKYKGYLKHGGSNIVYWKGKYYEKSRNIDANIRQHQSYPWEIDVAEKQQVLYPIILDKISKSSG